MGREGGMERMERGRERKGGREGGREREGGMKREGGRERLEGGRAVSYTHLTLPTMYCV